MVPCHWEIVGRITAASRASQRSSWSAWGRRKGPPKKEEVVGRTRPPCFFRRASCSVQPNASQQPREAAEGEAPQEQLSVCWGFSGLKV